MTPSGEGRGPAWRFAGVVLLVLAGFAVPTLVMEAALRATGHVDFLPVMFAPDEHTLWRVRPDVRERSKRSGYFDYVWTTNTQGFRATREYGPATLRGGTRILMLGDSFTFGVGVHDHETYPSRLEQLLSADCGGGFEVINAGVGGFGTSHALALLEHDGLRLEPDVVVVGLLTPDWIDDARSSLFVIRGDSLVENRDGRVDPWGPVGISSWPVYRWLIRNSAFVNWLRDRAAAAQLALTPPKEPEPPVAVPGSYAGEATRAAAEQRFRLTQRLLERVRAVTEDHGARLVVVLVALGHELRGWSQGDESELADLREAEAICLRLGLTCVNFAEWYVRGYPGADTEALYIQGEGHMNELGYRLLATSLAERLLSERIVQCKGAQTIAESPL